MLFTTLFDEISRGIRKHLVERLEEAKIGSLSVDAETKAYCVGLCSAYEDALRWLDDYLREKSQETEA